MAAWLTPAAVAMSRTVVRAQPLSLRHVSAPASRSSRLPMPESLANHAVYPNGLTKWISVRTVRDMTRTVLISGAGIAGPSLAYWLGRLGDDVTVVERAPGPRTSGAAVDFRGDQLALLTRMGVLDRIRAAQTGMGEQVIVDATGRRRSAYPAAIFSGEVEIDRADLAQILHEHSAPHARYVFGDRIATMDRHDDGVDVTFASGTRRRYDLVVGADGLHSVVRRLTFGDGHGHHLGYYAASFEAPNTFGIDHSGVIHNAPGRYVGVAGARDNRRALVQLMFAAPELEYDRGDLDAQKALLARHFAGVG